MSGLRAPAGRPGRRQILRLAAAGLAAAGCGALRGPLDVPPGHRIVMGAVALTGFPEPRVVIDMVREDGTFRHELAVDLRQTPFLITLPPGRYQVTRLRMNEAGRTFPEETAFPLQASFEVGDAPAVYVGRLDIERVVFARALRVSVRDEYERAVPAFRARYPDLPAEIARDLMQVA